MPVDRSQRRAALGPVLERLRKICLALPGASEAMAWGHPNFRVGKKTFAALEVYKGELSIALKVGVPKQQELIEDPRFYVTPYVGKQGWVSLRADGRIDWREVKDLVLRGYRCVAPKRRIAAIDGREKRG